MASYTREANESMKRPPWFGRRAADDPAVLDTFAGSFARDGGALLLRRAARGEAAAPSGARSVLWKVRERAGPSPAPRCHSRARRWLRTCAARRSRWACCPSGRRRGGRTRRGARVPATRR